MAISEFTATELVSRSNVNQRITQANKCFPVSLYSNSSGTTSTIPLSDSIANYSKIGIYYYTEGATTGCAFYTEFDSSVSSVLLCGVRTNDAGNSTFLKSIKLTCSGTSISFAAGWQNTVKTSSVTFTADTASLAIYQVVGYKY